MYLDFAAEFIIWHIDYKAKFHVIYSIIGLNYIYDAPIPIPVNPFSTIGVSITLSGPNSSRSPFETL